MKLFCLSKRMITMHEHTNLLLPSASFRMSIDSSLRYHFETLNLLLRMEMHVQKRAFTATR